MSGLPKGWFPWVPSNPEGAKGRYAGIDVSKEELTIMERQSINRLHRPGRKNITHIWIDDYGSIDQRIWDALTSKAETAIRMRVQENVEREIEQARKIQARSRQSGTGR